MSQLKTRPTRKSVAGLIRSIQDSSIRSEAQRLDRLFRRITKMRGKVWGTSIIGYGSYDYRYPTGNSGTWMRTGFSRRKDSFSIYIMSGYSDLKTELKALGKHKRGVGCLYVKRLDDIDLKILEKMIRHSLRYLRKTYP